MCLFSCVGLGVWLIGFALRLGFDLLVFCGFNVCVLCFSLCVCYNVEATGLVFCLVFVDFLFLFVAVIVCGRLLGFVVCLWVWFYFIALLALLWFTDCCLILDLRCLIVIAWVFVMLAFCGLDVVLFCLVCVWWFVWYF